MKCRKQDQPQHICTFNKTNKTLDALFPPGMMFRKIRRKFREIMLVSEENGRRRFSPKGSASYLFEKERHLTQHYYMIHPYSKFRQYWEIAVIIEILLGLVIRSFFISQLSEVACKSLVYQIVALLCDLFELADATIIRCLTGYIDVITRNVALETRKVFFYNMKQICFHINILISLPFDFVLYFLFKGFYIYPHLKCWIFLKIIKMIIVYRYIVHISKIYNWSDLTFRILFISLSMFIICHWLSCLLYLGLFCDDFGPSENKFKSTDNSLYRHFFVVYLVSTVFYFQNGLSNNIQISTTKDMSFFILLMIATHLSNVICIGFLIHILAFGNSSYVQYKKMIQEVQKFLIQENLPKHIHKKVKRYFEFRFRYRYFREKVILETLSPPLKQEIANFLCMNLLINNQSVFKGIPQELANALCLKLKFEIFLDGDVIIRAGNEAKKIFFISCGSIAIYSKKGKEIIHLYRGQQFGLSALMPADNHYKVTAIALEMSECYVLRYRDFISDTANYPQHRSSIIKAAGKRRMLGFRTMENRNA